MAIIERGLGLEPFGNGGPASAEVADDDTGEVRDENLAMLNGMDVPVSGDPAAHLPIHARFAMTSLGQAMPRRARERLATHMHGHVMQAIGVGGRDVTNWEEAARLAKLVHGVKE